LKIDGVLDELFDYENPNERMFLLLVMDRVVVAQNTDEPDLFSTATVYVLTVDENDNKYE